MNYVTNPESPKRPLRRQKFVFIAVVAALFLLYLVSPYYSVWRFGEALRAHDMDALAARVDFDAVRGSLKQQIRDHFLGVVAKNKKKNRLAEFLVSSENSPLDQLVDAYVTPEGLAAIISDPNPIRNASSLSSIPSADSSPKEINWSKGRRAFFTSPRDFAIDREDIKLNFRFTGLGWKLNALDLQLAPTTKPSE